ncbi:hypothetical protein KKF59_00595 [Patescibacteria group bacterium]|nr:hypothetical protein [Patescibacteria group bacterium]MBU1034935.1 hypothetical protein [Patescibacteria group bacterium]MBU1630109.1 hypothetical protein [Patescibacteria group bacterium]MBU1907614.1 hypothetical protein [Patescibacteria group bacterium]
MHCIGKAAEIAGRASVFSRRHFAAFLLACAVGLAMVSSGVAFRIWMGSDYRGIGMVISDVSLDNAWYHAVMQEALEGGRPWNAILAENKSAPYPVPDLAERILAMPGRLLSLDSATLLLVFRFLLPALLVLSLYGISWYFTRSKLFALVASAATTCLSFFLYSPANPFAVLFGTSQTLPYALFDRPVHPQFEAPLLWIFLFLAVRLVFPTAGTGRMQRVRYLQIGVVGALLGFFTHTYFWAWTWGFAALAVLFAVCLIKKTYQGALHIVFAAGLALLIGAPKIWELASSLFVGGGSVYGARLSVYFGHVLAARGLNLPILATLLLFIWRRKFASAELRTFAVAGLSATLIALNQQIVTGISLQPDHYTAIIGASVSAWILTWVVWICVKNRGRFYERIFAAVIIIVSLAAVLVLQFRIFTQMRGINAGLQDFAEVAEWLNSNADNKTAVFANSQIGLLVPIYTRANLWWHFYAMAVPTDDVRIMHSAYTSFSLCEFTSDDIARMALRQPQDLAQNFTLSIIKEDREGIVAERLQRWQAGYEDFQRKQSLPEAVRAYRIDYVLYDKKLDQCDPRKIGVSEAVMENARFALYKIR